MAKTAPKVLNTSGKKFWREVTDKYTLRVDELRTLESACRALDMVDLVTKDWTDAGQPLTSTGSMGQLVEHPMLGSIDRAQKAFELYMKRLALPDEAAGAGEKPNQQRQAAQTRWAAAHGRSA
jgi:hypothetical protein